MSRNLHFFQYASRKSRVSTNASNIERPKRKRIVFRGTKRQKVETMEDVDPEWEGLDEIASLQYLEKNDVSEAIAESTANGFQQ